MPRFFEDNPSGQEKETAIILDKITQFRDQHIDEPIYTDYMKEDSNTAWMYEYYKYKLCQVEINAEHGGNPHLTEEPDPLTESQFALLREMVTQIPETVEEMGMWMASFLFASEVQVHTS
jgi:hypothetical protein